jgi:glutamate/tyrosine decarboxylase-like PLP-dependent enzyme
MARQTFAYTGDYAKQLSDDPIEGFAFFEESIELSRRCRALKLWLSLRYHGLGAFRAAIKQDLAHAQRLVAAVRECVDLEVVAAGELSAVCFRHLLRPDASEQERNQFNMVLMKRIVRRGRVYLSNAMLEGKFCLRVCIVNHLTKDSDIEAVLPEVLTAAAEVARSKT